MKGRFGLAWVVVLACACWTEGARAQATWLEWHAPEECPSSADIDLRVAGLIGQKLEPTEELRVNAAVSGSERGWAVELDIDYAGSRGHRSVIAKTCGEAADFVALTVALAVHPELLSGSPEEAVVAAVPPPEAVEEDAPAPEEPSPAPAPEPPPEEQGLTVSVQAGAVASWLSLPSPRVGPRLELGLDWGQLHAFIAGAWLPLEAHTFNAAERDVAFGLVWGEVGACYRLPLGRVTVGPCLAFQLGQLGTAEVGGSRTRQDPWVGPGVGLEGRWLLAPWLAVNARLQAVVPLARTSFVLSEGTVVHELPWVDPQTQLGLELLF